MRNKLSYYFLSTQLFFSFVDLEDFSVIGESKIVNRDRSDWYKGLAKLLNYLEITSLDQPSAIRLTMYQFTIPLKRFKYS